MPFTGEAKDVMVDAVARGTTPAISAAYVGLLTAGPARALTAVGATGVFSSVAHGYANGDVVVLSALTGGSRYVAGRLYRVVGASTDTFELANTVGGAVIAGGSDVLAGTATRLTEISGGSPAYARLATAFAAAVDGGDDDNAPHALNVPPGGTVDYVGFWSAGSGGVLVEASAVTQEQFAAQGVYSVLDVQFDLNAAL